MIDAVVKVSMPLNDDRPSSFFACPLFSFLVCVRARVRACVCAVLQLRFDLCRPSPHFSTIVSWKEKYMCINIYIYIFNYCFKLLSSPFSCSETNGCSV